jgi:hypothetical protein
MVHYSATSHSISFLDAESKDTPILLGLSNPAHTCKAFIQRDIVKLIQITEYAHLVKLGNTCNKQESSPKPPTIVSAFTP